MAGGRRAGSVQVGSAAVNMTRRGFLQSCLVLAAAPAIVRADSLMRIIPREVSLYVPNRGMVILVPKVVMASMAGIEAYDPRGLIDIQGGAMKALKDSLRYYDARDVQIYCDTGRGNRGERICTATARFNECVPVDSEE